MLESQAREWFQKAVEPLATMGGDPIVKPLVVISQGISFLETDYSMGWDEPGRGSWNMGAMQGSYHGAFFVHTDTHPQPDGSAITYTTHFKKYPDAVSGARDLVEWLLGHPDVKLAIRALAPDAAVPGQLVDVDLALYHAHYYEGEGTNEAVDFDSQEIPHRVIRHWQALSRGIWRQINAFHEQPPAGIAARTITIGDWGPDVNLVRQFLAAQPGITFDPAHDLTPTVWNIATSNACKAFQSRKGLTPDGEWGPKTNAAAVDNPDFPFDNPYKYFAESEATT